MRPITYSVNKKLRDSIDEICIVAYLGIGKMPHHFYCGGRGLRLSLTHALRCKKSYVLGSLLLWRQKNNNDRTSRTQSEAITGCFMHFDTSNR